MQRRLLARFTAARTRFGGLLDFLWPTVAPWSEAEQAREEAKQARFALWDESLATGALAQTPEQAAIAVRNSKDILDIQRAREVSVESRMTGFLTLSSIGVSASLVGLAQQAYLSLGTSAGLASRIAGYAAMFFTAYIFAQSTCLFFAALNGLKRRGYSEPIPAGLLPVPGDTPQTLARRQVRTYLACARDHDIQNSEKTNQMEVVHAALRNIAVGLTGLVVALAILFVGKPPIQASPQSTLEILRSHHDLTEMLRGRQGPPAVQGMPGRSCQCPSDKRTQHHMRRTKHRGLVSLPDATKPQSLNGFLAFKTSPASAPNLLYGKVAYLVGTDRGVFDS